MTSWEERMAERARERRHYVEAEERAAGEDGDGLWGGAELGFTANGLGPDIMVSDGYALVLSRQDEVPERKRCGEPLAIESDTGSTGILGIVYCMERRGHEGQHRNTCLGSGPVLWDDPPDWQ